MTDVSATVRDLIHRREWDELVSVLEEAVLLRPEDDEDEAEDDEDAGTSTTRPREGPRWGHRPSSASWSSLLDAFCAVAIAGGGSRTTSSSSSGNVDDGASSSSSKSRSRHRRRTRPSSSSVTSILSLLLLASPGSCDGTAVVDDDEDDGNTILHRAVDKILDVSATGRGRRRGDPTPRRRRRRRRRSRDGGLAVVRALTGARPDLLSRTNARGQTPLHRLLDDDGVRHDGTTSGLRALAREMAGSTSSSRTTMTRDDDDDDNGLAVFDRATAATASRSEARRTMMRVRDSRGRLPLHCAAACPWVDERTIRALVDAYPEACHSPVDASFSSSSQMPRYLEYYRGKDLAIHVLHRRLTGRPIVLTFDDNDDDDDDADNDEDDDGSGDSDCSSVVVESIELSQLELSQCSGGSGSCGGSSSAGIDNGRRQRKRRRRRRRQRHASNEDDESSGDKGRDENRHSYQNRGAISALLEPLVAAANDADVNRGEAARLACAATGSSGVAPAAAKDARDGGGNDDDDDDDINSAMLSSLKNSIYNMSVRSLDAAASSPNTILLPLHIAAIHGVSHEILEGLCHAYPEGVATPMIVPLSHQKQLPIELFEEGLAGCEVRNATNDVDFLSLSADYFSRSDLLFSYFPEAVSSLSSRAAYCIDKARLARFELLIRSEARHPPDSNGLLSDMAGSVWLFICRSTSSSVAKPRKSSAAFPNFYALIGRILYGLDPHSVQRLHYVRTTSIPEGVLVPPLGNGRTVLEEARERSSNGSMAQMLKENFFHSSVLSYLDFRDALSYSGTCRKSWTRGVRLLQEGGESSSKNGIETMDRKGSWKLSEDCSQLDTPSQGKERARKLSRLWQKLDLPFVTSCTHTVFISCNITYQSRGEKSTCVGGGLLVVGEDVITNGQSGPVVASDPVKAAAARGDGKLPPFSPRVCVSFNHSPGRSYTLWYYGSKGHTLTISNLAIRQLVYACDYNGHNPLHVLLSEGDNPSNIAYQLGALVAAGFGSNLPIHYALKVGVLERTLRCLIEAIPAALLDIDGDRRTPLHVAFDSSRMPYLGVVQALLTSPGVNASQLKDSRGKLPIHIAAERGAGEALLRVLVDAYADGCYRLTDDGDLPLHLLVRSGSATQVTVELLIRPIMCNPTICSYPGSSGINLPLHIASEYRCKYSIFEGLLTSYSEGANIKRQLVRSDPTTKIEEKQGKKDAKYALEIFEEGRGSRMKSNVGTQTALGEADFNLRSDLIFVHNPNVPKSTQPYFTIYFRDEKDRIERLAAVIKREASQCSQKVNNGESAKLTEMAQLAWCWMCTNDHYTEVIKNITQNLSIDAVRFLASTENPKSEPITNTPIKDCSTPKCSLILKSRLSFLGRYILDHESSPLHKSESCVILRAKDIGAMESYISIQSLLDAPDPDIDDYSHECGSVYGITGDTIEIDRFIHFARKIGLSQSGAIAEIEKLLLDSCSSENMPNLKESGVKKSLFNDFCREHSIDAKGCRSVVIKFMKSKQSFELEKQCRDILCESGKSYHIVPILNQFSFGSSDEGNSNDFTRGLFEVGPPLIDLSGMRFGIVMPCANGDLRDIFYREGVSSSSLCVISHSVGESLRALHEQGITHGNLQLNKVLRYGQQMVLSDFGSAIFLKTIGGINAIGGSSTKLCSSILPPEMIAKIELSNRESYNRFMKYWSHVELDSKYLRALTPHERDSISHYVMSSKSSSATHNNKIDLKGWKGNISSLLESIRFEDLPPFLAKCNTYGQFSEVWERMCENFNIWEYTLHPRHSDDQCAYMLKSFENRIGSPQRDVSLLPYKLVPPSEKVDVWIFGIFIYELCSGGNPFHSGYRGDLRGADNFSRLYEWNRSTAEKNVRENVQDPLAQDLLCQILLPADERLPTISAVLKHPFFSPKSQEAERFLEKHEEMQLLRDNTVTVRKVNKSLSLILDDSIEKYCKIAFATDQIAFPCCLMVLPYTLNFNESSNRPLISSNPKLISLAVRLGKCLLGINKATARMSFWLRMGVKMRAEDSIAFKSQMQGWLIRAQTEPCVSIAMEIVSALECEPKYAMICNEVLAYDGSVSKAKSYMRDPIRAARREIKQHSDDLIDLYQSISYLYLVDEVTMHPSCAFGRSKGGVYPIQLEPNPKQIVNVLLPFMNIVVMKALARNGFDGLASLLGLPPNLGIHESWRSSEPGLLHSMKNSASIEEFVSLQRIIRNDDHVVRDDASQSYHSGASASHDGAGNFSLSSLCLIDFDLSPGDPAIAGIPMELLEFLFRERDPDRQFGKLKRVTSASQSKSLGLWTSAEAIRQMQSMVEIAELEGRLTELKLTLDQAEAAAADYAHLLKMRRMMEKTINVKSAAFSLGEGVFSADVYNDSSEILPIKSKEEAHPHSRNPPVHEQRPNDEDIREHVPVQDPGERRGGSSVSTESSLGISTHVMPHTRTTPHQEEIVDIYTHRMPHQTPSTAQNQTTDEDEAALRKKMRKSKRRFRPWFTAC